MKKKLLLLTVSIFMLTTSSWAQNVGINSTGSSPDASAGLDVSFTNKGLLIPRVALTATNTASPISSPTTSLLVYNTAKASSGSTAVTPGYYYWTGTIWNRVLDATSGSWLLTGNAGTTVGTNFLGTTDNVSLSFKTNNTERMRILNSGNIGIGTTSPSNTLHVNGSTRMDGDFYNQQVSYDTDFSSTWTSTANNTWEDTNLEITIDTHGSGANGSDVFVATNLSFDAYADNFCVRIVRDGSTLIAGGCQDGYIDGGIFGGGGARQSVVSIQGIDNSVSAGSHTYTVQIIVSDSDTDNEMADGSFTVMEIKK